MGFRDLSLSYDLGNESYRSHSVSGTDLRNSYLVQVSHAAALHQRSNPIDEARTVISQNTNCYSLVQINLGLRVFEI